MRCCEGLEARVTEREERAVYTSGLIEGLASKVNGQSDYLRKVDLANETHEADLMDLRDRVTELERVRQETVHFGAQTLSVPGFDREEAAEDSSGFDRAEWHEASSDYWQARSAEAESELDELKLKSSERRSEDRRNIERLERRAEHMEGMIRRKDDHFEERTTTLKNQVREAEARLGVARRVAARFERELVEQTNAVQRFAEAVLKLGECLDLGNDQPCFIGGLRKLREALAPFTGDER